MLFRIVPTAVPQGTTNKNGTTSASNYRQTRSRKHYHWTPQRCLISETPAVDPWKIKQISVEPVNSIVRYRLFLLCWVVIAYLVWPTNWKINTGFHLFSCNTVQVDYDRSMMKILKVGTPRFGRAPQKISDLCAQVTNFDIFGWNSKLHVYSMDPWNSRLK